MQIATQRPVIVKPSIVSNYDDSAISWVRMIAMFSIVMVHCIIYPIADTDTNLVAPFQSIQEHQIPAYQLFNQFLRFGSIHFFLVAGFLIGKKADATDPSTYFKRRLNTVTIPYLLSFGLFWLKSLLYTIVRTDINVSGDLLQLSLHKAKLFLFTSAYWFVPNYILGLGSLLLFRHYLDRLWFGMIWLTFAGLYGLNLHLHLFRTHTSTLFLSFTFFMWFGAYLARHPKLLKTIQVIKSRWWLFATLVLFFISYEEGVYLTNQMSDPFHSLRISNQLFAIALFGLLFRNNYLSKLTWFRPRQESFGIYLYHMFFAVIFIRIGQYSSWWPFRYDASYTGGTLVLLSVVQGVLVYTCTLLFVKVIAASRLRWVIGLKAN